MVRRTGELPLDWGPDAAAAAPPAAGGADAEGGEADGDEASREEAGAGAIAEVAVNAPLDRLFHYRIPPALAGRIERGHRVLIPFGRRSATGVCVGFPEEAQVPSLKPIRGILQPECRFDDHILELTRWIAGYYHASWGEVLEAALPPAIRAGKDAKREHWIEAARPAADLLAEAERLGKRARARARLLEALARAAAPLRAADLIRDLPSSRDAVRKLEAAGFLRAAAPPPEESSLIDDLCASAPPATGPTGGGNGNLHPDQSKALDEIAGALDGRLGSPPPPVLLHGVTGSGKTEVYVRALARVLLAGGRGLVLVPEISLTPQTVRRFRDGLPGVPIAVLHSMLSPRQRAAQWREIQSGRVSVVIGARSAVFAPVPGLRLIIVDEEHEPSFKQESSPRYHGRDAAVVRARLLKIPIVLGSATPSLESYHNARAGKYRLVEMPCRVTGHDLPSIAVVAMGPEFYRPDGSGLISGPLEFQIRQCLKRGEQAILFLNRRGFSTFLHCVRCGFVLRCRYCDISLTYHRREQVSRCHYCDARYEAPGECPECRFPHLRRAGVGTEKVAEVIARDYEGARVSRLDRDAARSHKSLQAILRSFSAGDTDILVGTQMLAKGHDFPRVSLVGIISADTGLHFPDFRSAERTFQVITQVSGRAGRGDRPGRVILQTFFPEHYAIRCAVANDYRGLFDAEAEQRRALGYPPFGRVAKVLVQDEKPERGERTAAEIADRLRQAAAAREGVQVLGPAPAPITRLQERHRFQILVKAPAAGALQAVLRAAAVRPGGRVTAEVVIDVDPQSLL